MSRQISESPPKDAALVQGAKQQARQQASFSGNESGFDATDRQSMDAKGGRRWVGTEYEREVTLLNRLKCMAARHFARV